MLRLLLATTSLLLWSTASNAHSIEPSRLNVYAIDGYTQFSVYAVNRYDFPATFVLEAFTDDTLSVPVTIPEKTFKLGSQNKRRLFIPVNNPPEQFYVCTRTVGTQDGQMQFATRVCSKVNVYE